MSDLITLARVLESVPGFTIEDEPHLATLITAASRAVETFCHRSFGASDHDELRDGGGADALALRHFPVIRVNGVWIGTDVAIEISNPDPLVQQARALASATGLTLARVVGGATSVDTTVTWATFPTIAAVAAAVVGLGGGWTAAAIEPFGDWPSADLVPIDIALDAKDRSARFSLFTASLADYRLDPATGLLRGGFPPGVQNIRIQYTAGFAVIPEDIQQASCELVVHWFREGRRETGLVAETLGDYSYRRAVIDVAAPPNVLRLLQPYRDFASGILP